MTGHNANSIENLYNEFPDNNYADENITFEELAIREYENVLTSGGQFPEDFFSKNDDGYKRACICFCYLCENILRVPYDLIPKVFLSSDGMDLLTDNKLGMLVPGVFQTVFDLVYTAYPDTMGPAYFLEDVELEGGWIVKQRYVAPSKHHTGGNFSVGYIAEKADGSKGFVKALDLLWAFRSSDPTRELQRATAEYNFERDILEMCKEARLNRVVKSLTYGTYYKKGVIIPVNYMIFECADGDVRDYLEYTGKFNYGWALRCLHHVSVGLAQLHSHGVAHQDLKSSNVLVFGGKESKIGDLGRSVRRGVTAPHENYIIAGDGKYAPPELLYGEVNPEWSKYRLGCDAYMLGSLAMFVFSQIHMTAALKSQMNPDHWHDRWGGSFRDVLPYIREAFDVIMNRFEQMLPDVLRSSLTKVIRELCEPDPVRRATPKGMPRIGSYYSLQPYVSKFNEMARKVELGIWRID